jgi:tetratricopeptide (TPR) repeat protein
VNQTAWAIVLGHPPGADPARGVQLADTAVKLSKSYIYLNTRGVALYRNGQYNDAETQLKEGLEVYTGVVGVPPGMAKKDGSATDQIFLAMTYYRLGQTEEALKWLDKAVKWLEALDQVKDGPRPTVWQRAEWELHRKEAEKLVRPAK